MTLALGIALAALASLALNASYLIQHAALATAPAISVRTPLRSLRELIRRRAWTAGAALGYTGLGLNVWALALAPLPLVQSIVAAGQVVVATGSRRATGRPATRRETAGALLMALALCLLVSSGGIAAQGRAPSWAALLAFEAAAGLVGVAVGTCLGARAATPGRRAHALGLAAGVFYGATTVAIAALLSATTASAAATAVASGAAVTAAGFFSFQRALQTGRPVAAVALMTAGTSAVAIIGGIVLLHDRVGSGPLATVLHLAGFALVPAAAALAAGDPSVRRSDSTADGRSGTAISPARPRSPRAALDRAA